MLPTLLFLVTMASGLTQTVALLNEPCQARVSDMTELCDGYVWTSGLCNDSIVTVGTNTSKSCDQIDLSWDYPVNNMTITFETPYTREHQPYNLSFDNTWLSGSRFVFYRVIDGKESEINSDDDVLVQKSDSNYQVILKIQAKRTLSLYVLFIHYNITKA